MTIFLQGRIDDHVSIPLAEIIQRALATKENQVTTFPFRELELFDEWDGIAWSDYLRWKKWTSMPMLPARKTPGEYWQQFFPSSSLTHARKKVPVSVGFQPAALFAVRRETITQHPRAFYELLMQEMFLGDMAHVNPETGHFLERLWLAIWDAGSYVCWGEEDVGLEERNELGQLGRGRWHRTPKEVEVDERAVAPGARDGYVGRCMMDGCEVRGLIFSRLPTPPFSDGE